MVASVGNTLNGAVAWTWTANAQITAATTSDFVASYAALGVTIILQPGGAAVFQPIIGEVQLVTGADPGTVFATIPFASAGLIANPGVATAAYVGFNHSIPIGPTFIPNGTRIAVRSRWNQVINNVGGNTRVYVTGYDGGNAPVGYQNYTLRGQQTGIQKGTSIVTPTGQALAVTPAVGAWGNWAAITLGGAGGIAAGDTLVMGMTMTPTIGVLAKWTIFEFGIGPAGSEVSCARLWFPSTSFCCGGLQLFCRPIWVKAGETLSVRARANNVDIVSCNFLYEQH